MFDPPGPMGAANPKELLLQLMNADESAPKSGDESRALHTEEPPS